MSVIDLMSVTKKTGCMFSRLIGVFEYEGERFVCYMADFEKNGKQQFTASHCFYNEDGDLERLEDCWSEEVKGENDETLFRALAKKFYTDVLKGE